MLLFGHRFIESENLYHIADIDAVTKTPPSSTLFLEFAESNLDVITHLRENEIKFALSIKSIEELLYASSLGALFVIVEKPLAKTLQNIAEEYLFDTKILAKVESEEELEELALLGIDGAIFPSAFIKISA